jgi:hypothetical protein
VTLRTSIHLYVLETLLHLLAATPAALVVVAATASLPPPASLMGEQGPALIIDVVTLPAPGVLVTTLVSAGVLLLLFLLASPLLMAGTVRSLASTGPAGPLGLVVLGARRYPRFLLLHVAYLGLCAGGSALLVWSASPLRGAILAFGFIAVCSFLRDLGAVVLRGDEGIRACLARIPALLARRPLPVLGGAVMQTAAVWLIMLGALRVQLELHGESLTRAVLLTLLVQALVLSRCLVRCTWLGALVRHDS